MNRQLLKNRSFLLLMQGRFVSITGSILQTFALSLYVLNKYESASLFASVIIVRMIPSILLGPIAGVFVDWFDRKKMIVILDIISGVSVLLVASIFFYSSELPLSLIYALSIILALLEAFFTPAVETIIPMIFNKSDLFSANTINQMMITLANVFAPVAGGLLMSVTSIGIVLLINGTSYILSAISEMFIQIPAREHLKEKVSYNRFREDFKAGIHFFNEKKILKKFLVILLILNFVGTPLLVIALPFYLKRVLLVSDMTYGVFNSIMISMTIFAMFGVKNLTKHYALEKIIRISFMVLAICTAVFTLLCSPLILDIFATNVVPLVLSLIFLSLAMMANTISNIAIGTMLQSIIPENKLGRVMTVLGAFTSCAIPLGQGLMGMSIDIMPLWMSILVSTLLMFVVAILAYNNMKDHQIVFE